jgi:Zn-dependent protease/predicted transcriptional regulator
MFGNRVTIGKLLGFPIKIDASWIFLAVLVTWSLATGVFPRQIEGLSNTLYWVMGGAGALALFASIIFHELGHAVVARRYGIGIRDITLFIFGGVAAMEDEPPNAKSEFWMAIAGPIASMVLAVGCWGIAAVLVPGDANTPAEAVIRYVGFMNGMLALFNIFPAFPLDGGRMLRAALWSLKGDLRWATRIASTGGSIFGLVLIALGIFVFVLGQIIPGLWWFMIGMFVRAASRASYQQVLLRQALAGEPVRKFMRANPVTVPTHCTVDTLVEDYIYRHHYKMMPVADNGHLQGCVTIKQIKDIPREEWGHKTVGEIMGGCTPDNSISPDADAMDALTAMNRTGNIRLMVVEDGQLAGVVTLKDLLEFLNLKMDLEGQNF